MVCSDAFLSPLRYATKEENFLSGDRVVSAVISALRLL